MKKIRNFLVFLILLVIAFGAGHSLGQKSKSITPSLALDSKSQTDANIRNLDFTLFFDVWDRLSRYYIDKNSLDSRKMIFGAITGMVASLDDPYTVFLPPDQNQEAKDDLGGKFEGIGAQLGVKDKRIVVIAPLKDSPSEKSGIKAGDYIIKVDGKETYNWTLPQAVNKIRGPKGSKVTLSIVHQDEKKIVDIAVTREEIKVTSVEWELKDVNCQADSCQKIVYLKLGRFGDNTNSEWNNAVNDIVSAISGIPADQFEGLILDVRNNPGGYLSGSVFIASEFIDEGTVVIQENADGSRKNYEVSRKGKLTDIPLVVLINKGSASASEIVAGALKVSRQAPLIGETTFGKGSIQEAQDLKDGAGIHITTAKWLLSDGTWINGDGLKPQYEQLQDENNPDSDLQLEKAIEVLTK